MKKLLFIVSIAFISLLTACSGSYDQKKVDELAKLDNPTEADYKEMVNQASYALGDLESAKDKETWCEKNEKEFESLIGLVIGLNFMDDEPGFPKDLKAKVKDLTKRLDTVTDGLKATEDIFGTIDTDDTEIVDQSYDEDEY